MSSLLLYGSYGFVGSLVAEAAVDRGVDVILAGRDGDRVVDQVDELGRPGRRFALDDPSTVAEALDDIECVLNCAGPFSNTADPLVEACIRTGTDYVDVTGEIPVIESIHDRDGDAREAGVTLLPAAGFSVIAMDCLAAHLAERFPGASALALGVDSIRVPSVGTLRTVVEGVDTGGAIRRNGHLERVPAGWQTRWLDFGHGERPAVTVPMGDVSAAYYTTGVPNVEVYAMVPPPARLGLKSHRLLAPVLARDPVQRALKAAADLVREGPSERARERGSALVWGEAREGDVRVVSRLETPDPYVVTVDGAVAAARRVLAGDADEGFCTPAGAFGPEFVFDLERASGSFDDDEKQIESGAMPAE
ncbi:saccharopine dehydrogenase family protein [Natronosalvus caseinilyticus]|uniref:saccharopine dehydrogenase family protein n=1 Tax=Natronosalvus caseinilyticus TaxID=2953747 RepID=UPI0028B1BC92|nr:saccharopine dehydrogenase NADP-binding domain-containing protein [Natronosalvus caseinilyticus]